VELTEGLHRAAQQMPRAPATICGEHTRSWLESKERIARLAGALREMGVRSDDRVAILAFNSDIYHEILLAIAWADAVFVPVNTRWSIQEIAFSLADCGTVVLLVDDNFVELVPALRAAAPTLPTVVHVGQGEPAHGLPSLDGLLATAPVEDARRGGAAIAAIYYTGGTSGRPRGVMLSHDNLIISALGAMASRDYVLPGPRYLHAAPMFHAADVSGWVCTNILGGTHLFVPRFDPAGVTRVIERHRVTDIIVVPTMMQMLVDAPGTESADLTSLRRIVYGGSPISDALIERVMKRLPGVRLTQTYAMTEMSPVMTLLGHEGHRDPRLRRSSGRAAPHVQLRVVDDEDRDVPIGTVGQVLARGGGQMLGYWKRREETRAALAGGWMHTGDLGYLDESGHLFVVDRIKDVIITGGENVYSTEVENALAAHPAVASCAVIGIREAPCGERVHAVVVLVEGASTTEDELREHVRGRLAHHKAPRSVEFVSSLPLSGQGKVMKRLLRARYGEGDEQRPMTPALAIPGQRHR
jgi:acyl-CoA synthetase (AMP-forming)/AMP-acid ligase II